MPKGIEWTKKSGEVLERKRVEKGWTQVELASQIGMSNSQLSKLEQGVTNIGRGTLLKLCVVLGCDPADLLGCDLPPRQVELHLVPGLRRQLQRLTPSAQERLAKALEEGIVRPKRPQASVRIDGALGQRQEVRRAG